MKATLLYRIASVVLLLFAAGHTFGFLKFKPASAEGLAVRDGMKSVLFSVGSKQYSYDGFYTGFGLYITAYLLFSALLSWHMGELANTNPQTIGMLGWAFAALQAAGLVLSWIYFFPVTAVFSVVVFGLAAAAAWSVAR
jgi:hypothetical protein